MHKHFEVLTTSSLFLSVRTRFPQNPLIFTSCFAFNSLAFSTRGGGGGGGGGGECYLKPAALTNAAGGTPFIQNALSTAALSSVFD